MIGTNDANGVYIEGLQMGCIPVLWKLQQFRQLDFQLSVSQIVFGLVGLNHWTFKGCVEGYIHCGVNRYSMLVKPL